MLSSPTTYPQVGSTAFLKPDGAQVRILRHNADGTRLVGFAERQPFGHGPSAGAASGNRQVAGSDLAETRDQALALPARSRRRRRK